MLEVLKVLRYIACVKYCTMNKGSNAMYVKNVKSSSIYTIRAVMLCISKVLKEVQNGLTHLAHNFSKYSTDYQSKKSFRKLRLRVIPSNTIHVKGVESISK